MDYLDGPDVITRLHWREVGGSESWRFDDSILWALKMEDSVPELRHVCDLSSCIKEGNGFCLRASRKKELYKHLDFRTSDFKR